MSATKPVDNPAEAFLSPHDGVAISFWIISIAMIAATVFFFAEAATVNSHWKTSLHVGGLVTLVAGVHYMYMREFWVMVHKSPIVYRYVDWSITVPLQMIEFWVMVHKSPIVYRYVDWSITVPLQMIEFWVMVHKSPIVYRYVDWSI